MIEKQNNKIVAKILIDIGAVSFSFEKLFTLTSGKKSPIYVDCRKIISFVKERNIIIDIAKNYIKQNDIRFDLLAGGETAGIPYSSFLSQSLNKPMIYVRKKPKGFGNNKQIEGSFTEGQKVMLVEDLATDGGSKIDFINALRKSTLIVKDIFVIFYYDIFNFNNLPLGKMDVKIHSLCTWEDIFDLISKENLCTKNQIKNLKNYLSDPDLWRKNNE